MYGKCHQKVGTHVLWPCHISVPDGREDHDGPCAAYEVPSTIALREAWVARTETEAASGAPAQEVEPEPETVMSAPHVSLVDALQSIRDQITEVIEKLND